MDLRNLPEHLSPADRCTERRHRIEQEFSMDLSAIKADPETIGHADERNCEQMFGQVPIPVGHAGPLQFTLSSGETIEAHLPLATTEGALVASVNRGCKILSQSHCHTASTYHGVTRSIALRITNHESRITNSFTERIHLTESHWKAAAESTSNHLKVLNYDVDSKDEYVFLTLSCDTDEAMGMNMATIAAQAVGQWIVEHLKEFKPEFLTVAANIDSDKKPSKRTHDRGRGYEVVATAELQPELIQSILKTSPEAMLAAADAKLRVGSQIAGAISSNLHAANVISALYLATGQDAAHVVEGSLADTTVSTASNEQRATSNENLPFLKITTHLPALLLGILGGGTTLPAQSQCLDLILQRITNHESRITNLHPCRQLAETIGAAVLAGEVSLLAAQASHTLAKSHQILGR